MPATAGPVGGATEVAVAAPPPQPETANAQANAVAQARDLAAMFPAPLLDTPAILYSESTDALRPHPSA
ncbi:MAG: hypothetical protein ABSB60_16680 [Terracidiphilus sp.]